MLTLTYFNYIKLIKIFARHHQNVFPQKIASKCLEPFPKSFRFCSLNTICLQDISRTSKAALQRCVFCAILRGWNRSKC